MSRHAEAEVLSAYLDGELEDAAAVGVEAHLGECAECAARLEGLQETVASLRRLERPPLPEAVTRGLRQRLARERRRPARGTWLDALLPWRSLQPGMAAGVLVIGAVLFLTYAGYLQHERERRQGLFSPEAPAATEAAPVSAEEGPPPNAPAPPEADAPPALRARQQAPAAAPAAPAPAATVSEREARLADAVPEAESEGRRAAAEPAPAPPPESAVAEPRREERAAAATLQASGEMAARSAPGAATGPADAAAPPAASADEPLTLGPGIEPPERIAGEELELHRVRDARWPPEVVLETVISRDGRLRMEDLRILQPEDLDPRLAAELRRTLATWRFRPATRDGQPVAVRMTLKVHVQLP